MRLMHRSQGWRLRSLLALGVAAALSLSACGAGTEKSSTGNSTGKGPISVLLISGVTGPTATVVDDTINGINASIDAVNAAGGVNGRKMKLTVVDNGGDPTRSVSELQKYLSKGQKPDLVFPGVSSPEALALTPLLSREKIISTNGASSAELNKPNDYPYHFGYMPTSKQQQVGLERDLTTLGAHRVAVMVGNDAFGSALAAGVRNELKDGKIKVDVTTFDLAALDLSIVVDRAMAKHPDAFFTDALGEPAHRIVEARTVVGATDIPMIVGPAIASSDGGPSNWASVKTNANLYTELYAAQSYVAPADRTGVLKAFYNNMANHNGIKKGGSAIVPMISYDMITLYAAAANEAGSTNPDKVKAALEGDMKYPPLVQWPNMHWTADNHFPTLSEDDTKILPRGALVDGLFKPLSG